MGGRRITEEVFKQRFEDINNNEFLYYSDFIDTRQNAKVIHKKCGFIFEIIPRSELKHKRKCICPKCEPTRSQRLIPYINDLYTTNKDTYELLKDKEDGHRFKGYSSEKTWFICPFCGEEIYREICNVSVQGLKCPICSDKTSYGEKMFYNILKFNNIDFKFQFSPKWAKGYIYDFCIENKKIIVEIDGSFHRKDNNLSGITKEESQAIDYKKDVLAHNNGYELIRITYEDDCYKNRFNLLKEHIQNQLANKNIFDVFDVDYEYFDLLSQKPFVYLMAEKWNLGMKTYDQLIEEFKFDRNTIAFYVKKMTELNLITESYEEVQLIIKKNRYKKMAISQGTTVLCNETGEIFNTYQEANKKYHANLSAYFLQDKRKFSVTLPDGTKLTWKKV